MADVEVAETGVQEAPEDKKAAKNAAKEAKKAEKAARKEAKKNGEEFPEDEESLGIGGRLIMAFVVLLIIAIWLVILAFLVKMDVGGFGSTVLFPVLKDVPYVNQILPGIEDYIPAEEEEALPYDTVEEACDRIKELEVEVEQLKADGSANSDYIAELEASAAELAEYKANEASFEEEKEKFYEEVVFSDNAPDINEYKTYYESIEPENAEAIYKQVVSQIQTDEEIEDYVKAYSSMKAKDAAAIFDTMTDDFDLVCEILSAMDASTRADILAAMSEENAAIITKMMEP
jgi:flagellar motility protein MotE (MotC chaperone)